MKCLQPIDAAVLADSWIAGLPESEEENIELHLLGCEECSTRLAEVMALADGVRRLAQEGTLRMVVSESFVQAAAVKGLRVREYASPAGGRVQCTVTAEDDMLIARLSAELCGSKRVDLSLCDELGREQMRMVDVPFRAEANQVVYQESIAHAKASPTSTVILRLIGFDEAGSELPLGEYKFEHTRSMPGPGGW